MEHLCRDQTVTCTFPQLGHLTLSLRVTPWSVIRDLSPSYAVVVNNLIKKGFLQYFLPFAKTCFTRTVAVGGLSHETIYHGTLWMYHGTLTMDIVHFRDDNKKVICPWLTPYQKYRGDISLRSWRHDAIHRFKYSITHWVVKGYGMDK